MTYGKPSSEPPLKPAVFHILLALSDRPLHGLGIADAVEAETGGEMRLPPGTLYRALKEMSDEGLLRPAETDEDPRRKSYALTEAGAGLLEREATRLARLVEVARRRNVITGSA